MSLSMITAYVICAVTCTALVRADAPWPRFSWDTLPVFLHTQNTTTGAWNDAAAARASRFPLSYSGMTGMLQPNGTRISLEISAPAMCRRISALNR